MHESPQILLMFKKRTTPTLYNIGYQAVANLGLRVSQLTILNPQLDQKLYAPDNQPNKNKL